MKKRERARAAGATTMAMRVVGDKEGKGNKTMVMATRIVGEWTGTATKKVMVMVTRVAGERWRQIRQRRLRGQ